MAATRTDEGFTVVELSIASLLSLMVLATAGSLLIGVMRDTSHVEARSRVQSDVSAAFDRMVVELREAESVDTAGPFYGNEIRELSPTHLVFTADVLEGRDGVEQVTYEVTNCGDDGCELVRTVVASAGTVAGVADYASGTVIVEVPLVTGVVLPSAARPLFEGVDWGGGVHQTLSTCASASPCDFDLVDIDIEVGVAGSGERRNQAFAETVRVRNHGR